MDKILEKLWYYPISCSTDEPSKRYFDLRQRFNFEYEQLSSTLSAKQLLLLYKMQDTLSEMSKEENKEAFIRGAKTIGGIFHELYANEKSRSKKE